MLHIQTLVSPTKQRPLLTALSTTYLLIFAMAPKSAGGKDSSNVWDVRSR